MEHPSSIRPGDKLVLPLSKRMLSQYVEDETGTRQLHLFYEHKEIVFDDPALFGFGEALASQQRFAAGDAREWGQGYAWEQIQPLLQHLVEEGVLELAAAARAAELPRGKQTNPLPPATIEQAPTWFDCEVITERLTGHAVELGYLELIVPIFRVAHMLLDGEGRQVGEANVFPSALRLDIPTTWRTCPQVGSRYHADRPMNVTALKSMRMHWKSMMLCLLNIRRAYLERFPHAANPWTVGHMERLSSIVLAVPAYLMMRQRDRITNGELHPVFSCMFRVTDGLRLTLHQMLFLPVMEKTLDPDSPITAAQLYEYAERNYAFFSPHGVCAGPVAMIKEFLDVMFYGTLKYEETSVELDEMVKQGMSQLGDAFDYGLYGLQSYAVVFSLWPIMARSYEALWQVIEDWDNPIPLLTSLKKRVKHNLDYQRSETLLANESLRQSRDRAYEDMYMNAATDLSHTRYNDSLRALLITEDLTQHKQAADKLRQLLKRKLELTTDKGKLTAFVDCIMDYLRQEQCIVKAACDIQTEINRLLQRPQPQRPFTAAQLDTYNGLLGNVSRLAYLSRVLEQVLNISIDVSKDCIEITDNERNNPKSNSG